jgi:hypothetical protein
MQYNANKIYQALKQDYLGGMAQMGGMAQNRFSDLAMSV